jgi:RHH-type proline utilization regulon transcriptional repressor/proline dehydrogenase/delta 1-pyrroline-5-carboxylate dehydrogenase
LTADTTTAGDPRGRGQSLAGDPEHTTAGGAPTEAADSLVGEAIELAARWMAEAERSRTRSEKARSAQLHELTADPGSLSFAMAYCDRVLRPESARAAARQLRHIVRGGGPRFLGPVDRALLRTGAVVAGALPGAVMPLARRRLRAMVGDLVADATDPGLARHLARLRAEGFRVNVNLLGEAVLGHAEAARRREAVIALMAREDVDYVSVKVSSVCAQLNLWSYDETLARTKDALREVCAAASSHTPPTFVNFDMEEYRDLALTLDAFTGLLDEPALLGLEAGVALQAYLPDSMSALRRLTQWALERRRRGGAGARVRIVKGANLAAERVDAAIHGWPLAPYGAKAETDASHKAMVDFALRPEHAQALSVGVGGHNLFDLAWAHLLADARGVSRSVSFEMLQGMAPAAARVVLATTGRVVLYTPVVHPADFDHALAYLFRRLEENAGGDNFLAALGGPADPDRAAAFDRERDRFAAAVSSRTRVDTDAWRQVPRSQRGRVRTEVAGAFSNEPDTDPTNTSARGALRHPEPKMRVEAPAELDEAGVDEAVAAARGGAERWGALRPGARAFILEKCADALAAQRPQLVALMGSEANKTMAEADAEVSEVVDFARFYAASARALDELDGAVARPLGIVAVVGPWNFPLAIPMGGALAALAAGNAVVLKPAPQTPAVAWAAVRVCMEAGIPPDVLRYARCADGPVGSRLVAHTALSALVLTGSYETAELFTRLAPHTPLLAETSGKNAMVVTPEADLDLAAADLVHAAFSHAGQKCSAASLGILVGDVATSERFRSQLVDATRSLELGPATAPRTMMGPLVEAPSEKLQRALTTLEGRQRWLLEPSLVDQENHLWSPGIIEGVQPGDWFARTECFGPVLGLIAARDLDEAIGIQNAVPYGLTAGLWSLDPGDVAHWADRVDAGNAYVNRPTTGAIVCRQPFGGYKRSVVGPGAKAGGPNYVLQLCRVDDVEMPALGADPAPTVVSALDALAGGLDPLERAALRAAARSDAYWWAAEFGVDHDEAMLFCESNVLRYRPLPGLTIRVAPGAKSLDVARLLVGALTVGAAPTVSLHPDGDDVSRRARLEGLAGVSVAVESSAALAARLGRREVARVRLLGSEHGLTGLEPRIHVDTRPPVLLGRVELLRSLREQTVSRTLHRFGNVVPPPDG